MNTRARFYNKLFFKIFLYFGIMLVVFAILISGIFLKLYEKLATDSYRQQLQQKGENLAWKLADVIETEDYDSYADYIGVVDALEPQNEDTWILSNPNAKTPMSKNLENIDYLDLELTGLRKNILEGAFQGKIHYGTSFSDVHKVSMVTVGVPILNASEEAVGAILIWAPVDGLRDMIQSSFSMILISIVVALMISFVIASIFAGKLSRPMSEMRRNARELAQGNYSVKMELKRKDELGDLARTLDQLSEQLQRNEVERRNLEQMRQDFFANVSHELRTPITVVRACTETLLDGVITKKEKIEEYFRKILKECQGMERLVGDLLTLAKLQNPEFTIEKEPVSFLQIMDDSIRGIKTLSEKKELSISIEKEEGGYMMLGDYDRLRQMVIIILDNAVKFSEIGGIICIKMSIQDKIIVSIEDNGIGIDPEELDHIFEKFYKSRLRQNAQGSGLGLAIANQVAWKHHGELNVESELNAGTIFTFRFPMLKDENCKN